MIVKNHTIELKDTSASEMARFRQIMLGIWRQQIEDDKNSAEMLKYVNTIELTNDGTTVSPLISILLWIKKNIGHKAKELKLSSLPKNAFRDPLSDTYKGHFIKCNRFLFETLVDLKNIKFEASFRPVETVFQLNIFDPQKKLVFRFETRSYEGLEYLAKFIDYDINVFKNTITQQYKKMILEAGNDKDKLDMVYEVIPDFILQALKTDQQMYGDIWKLLDQNPSDTIGRDENKGILNILKTLRKKDAKKLYEKLYQRPLWVMKIYERFSDEHRRNFVALLMILSKEFNHKIINENNYAVIPDGYWLEKSTLKVSWTKERFIKIEGYGQKASNLERLIVNAIPSLGPSDDNYSALKVPPMIGTDQYLNEVIKPMLTVAAFDVNPMDFVPIRSVAVISKEQTLLEETRQLALFLKYTADELSDKVFWDVVNIATTLAGGSGAVRVLATKGAGWLLKTAAILQLTKATLDLVMLNDNAKKALRKAGLGILVDNWTTISITTDLAFLSLDGLFALAKYGKKGVKILKELKQVDEAAHLENQTEKAFTEIEKQTDVDVSKMTEQQFEEFNKKLLKEEEILEEINQLDEISNLKKASRKIKKYSGKRPDKPIEETIDINGEITEYGKWYYERPSWKPKTVNDVWGNAKKKGDGIVIDKLSDKEITWDKSIARGDQWHMGHKYGYEFRKHQLSSAKRKISIKQFREEYNTAEFVDPELPASNLGHKGEAPDNIYFGH